MSPLTPYPITGFKSGIITYVKPWIRPPDAFSPLINMYPYRDTLTKRNGYSTFGNQLADQQPVMAIMQRIDQNTGLSSLLVATTQNLYLYDSGTQTFNLISTFSNWFFLVGTINSGAVLNGNVGITPLTPSSVTITATSSALETPPLGASLGTVSDNGAGVLTGGNGVFLGGAGTINYATGAFSFTFDVAITLHTNAIFTVAATGASGYFSGTIANFFNFTNWQPTDPNTFVESASYTIMTNGVDPVTYYDGNTLQQPFLPIDNANSNYIIAAQDIDVYKNSLLLFRVSLASASNTLNQSVAWSAPYTATNFINNITGLGGLISVATGDIFVSHELLRDAVILFFTNSTWVFQYTGILSNPFRVDRLSLNKRSNCPYGTIAYDERCTSIGGTGFIACDGVNVQRYDIPIVDYYQTEMSEQYYNQVFSQRYDNLNQTWILYVSNGTNNPVVGGVAPGSDRCLIYNHLENTWATYTWSIPMTCMGLFFNVTGITWADLPQQWQVTPATWKSYGSQALAPILLMGDTTGNVYMMDDDLNIQDNTTPISVDLVGTRWSPTVPMGQKLQFTYVDLYYSLGSFSPLEVPVITVSFYVDDSQNTAFVTTISLDGDINSEFTWKRIYCNLIGQFVRIEISGGEENFFEFPGLILWARPSGRFTAPGPLL